MPKARRIQTAFSKGELSPLIEGRPDLAAYYEGCKTLENWLLLRQSGVTRRPGTKFVKEVKDSTKDTILIPFEFSVTDSYMLEFGHLYIRVFKNGAPVLTSAGGPQVEIVTPYTETDLRSIHFTQSADVLFLFHPTFAQRKLSRASDTSWTLSTITYTPPPSFEADTDLVATLGIGANTGTGIKMRAGSAVFLAGDIGRQVIAGAGRAVITAVDDTSQVTADILDAFAATITAGPNTCSSVGTAFSSVAHGLAVGNFVSITSGAQSGQVRRVTVVGSADTATLDAAFPADVVAGSTWNKVIALASGGWFLRLSPQTTLDPNIKEPVKAQVTLVAGLNAFRTADVGKFIHIYGGVVKITVRDTALQVKGDILSALSLATAADPAAAPAGAWTLEEASWSAARGFSRTGEFFQGRLGQAGTTAQPTTWWLSQSDDFDNYAVGTLADDAVEYLIASRQINRIEWLADNIDLFIGTAGAEFRAQGERNGEPIGGDVIPLVERLTPHGCAPIQPIVLARKTLFLDRSQKKVLLMAFSLEEEGFDASELTDIAEHVTGSGIRTGPLGFRKRPDPTVFFVRLDGQLVALTYLHLQRVIGFTRFVTDGLFEAVAVIPRPTGKPDQVWVIVNRTIGGATKRYVEYFEEEVSGLALRTWTSLQTDSAVIYDGASTVTITGLSHLNGKTVDVVADAGFVGTKVVSGGQITLDVAATEVEVGLDYVSTLVTMRPAIEGSVVEGLPRSWNSVFVRLKDSIGGKVNGELLQYVPSDLDELGLFTGDRKITGSGWDVNDGRITVEQAQPYPFTVLATFGEISFGDHD